MVDVGTLGDSCAGSGGGTARRAGLVVLLAVALAVIAAPAARADSVWSPFALASGVGLSAQYGYAPDYTRNVPAFDSADRAYLRSRTANADATSYVATLVGGTWQQLDFSQALRDRFPTFVGTVGASGQLNDRIVFDRQDRAYNPLTIRLRDGSLRNVLMVSWDLCRSWKVFDLPSGNITTEQWVGHNEIDGPPFLAIWRPSPEPYIGHGGIAYSLRVTQPRLDGETLVVPASTLVTTSCLGLSRGSGGSSFAVTHGDSTWFVWPGASRGPSAGVPQCIARYDHLTGAVSPVRVLAVTKPANDHHNQPAICLDSRGILHVVGGAHGTAMPYTHALAPYSSDDGWTAPIPALTSGFTTLDDPPVQSGRQTYASFVCDSTDTLHLITRQWRRDSGPYFPGQTYGALVHQSCPVDGDWGPPTVIVVPSETDYSIYSQKLALDHRDRLFLSCSYAGGAGVWEDGMRIARMLVLGRDATAPGSYGRRMLLVSEDGGASWRFATDADLALPDEAPVPPAAAAPHQARRTAAAAPAVGWLSPSPQGNQLTAISMVDDTYGWAAGTHGTIMRTGDGGVTWHAQSTPTTADVFALGALGRRSAWAIGEGGLIIRTDDGGATWQQQASGVTDTLFGVAAISSLRACVVGTRGVVLTTVDGGRTWLRRNATTSQNLFCIAFRDTLHGVAGGALGYTVYTADGGRTWRPGASHTTATLFGVALSGRRGIAVGDGGAVLRTIDGGLSWHPGVSGTGVHLAAVRMVSSSVAWASGAGGCVLSSRDGGRTWRHRQLPVVGMAGAMDAHPGSRVWTAGVADSVCASRDAGRSWQRLTRGPAPSLNAVAWHDGELWVAGARGRLAVTTADCAGWKAVGLGTASDLAAIAFAGAEGWVVGDGGVLARSADGGRTWARLDPPAGADLAAVAALGDGHAWVAGAAGRLLGTSDGGATWRRSDAVPTDLHCVTFIDVLHGWAGGGAPYGEGRAVTLRTSDGGDTWESVEVPIWGRVLSLHFVDQLNGWAAAEDWGVDGDAPQGVILVTGDGGRTWTRQAGSPAVLTGVTMDVTGAGLAVGAQGAMLATSDGGASWQEQLTGTDNALRAVALPAVGLPAGLRGWVVGDDGTVLALSDPSR